MRASAVRAASVGKRGVCATSVIRLVYGEAKDPLVRARTQLLSFWVRHMASHPVHKLAAGKFWHKCLLGLGKDGKHWNRVGGPMSVVISTLIDIGWGPLSPYKWADRQGNEWLLQGSDVSALVAEVTRTVSQGSWVEAALHPQGSGLQLGGDLAVAQKVIRAYERLGDPSSAGMARCVVAGGVWGESRRFDSGYRPDDICRRCRQSADTDRHRLWQCPANREIQHPAVLESEELCEEAVAQCHEFACFWVRGIIPSQWVTVPSPPEQLGGKWVPSAGARPLSGGFFASDGSGGKFSSDPQLRRCGWAWVQLDPARPFQVGWNRFGALHGDRQTVPRAELVAILDLLAKTSGDIVIYTDHLNIVKGFAKGKSWTTRSENSDLWDEFWELSKEGGRRITLLKVPAHLDDPQKIREAMESLGPEVIVGNHVADALAGRAASASEVPSEAVAELNRLREKAAKIIRRAVVIGLAASSLPKEPDRMLRPEPKRRRRAVMGLQAAKRTSSHSVVPLGDRRWRCTKCLGVSPPCLAARWFFN